MYYDAELHIVCVETADSKATRTDTRDHIALGFLFKLGEANPFFEVVDFSRTGNTVAINGAMTFGNMVA